MKWLIPLLLLCCLPAHAQFTVPEYTQTVSGAPPATTVVEDGTGYSVAGSGAHTFTLTNPVTAGQGVIVVAHALAGVSTLITACSDNGTGGANTYTVEANGSFSSASLAWQSCSTFAVHPLTTITTTNNTGSTLTVHVFLVNNFASSSWADATVAGVTSGTGTTKTANAGGAVTGTEVVIATCAGVTGVTISSPYTALVSSESINSRSWSISWHEYTTGTPAATCTMSPSNSIVVSLQGREE